MGEGSESVPGAATPQGRPGGTGKVGRPKGPDRIARTVRLLEEHDRRLAAEVERQRLSQQYLVEKALAEYVKRLDRQRRRMQGAGEMQAAASGVS
jgi:predicted transcriptional regulator